MLDLLVPALIGALGIIGAAVVTAMMATRSYRVQKRMDRENYAAQKVIDRNAELLSRRGKEYERYLSAYRGYVSLYDFDPPPADNSEQRIAAVNEYWLAYSTLFHIASDSMLLAATRFHRLAWLGEPELIGEAYDEQFKELYATLLIEIRKEAYPGTEMHKDLLANLPFNMAPR
jgi:hypothetical protein